MSDVPVITRMFIVYISHRTLKRLSRWFDPNQPSAFASVRYVQHIGYTEVRNQVGISRVLWASHAGPEFTFDDQPTSAKAWIKMIQDMFWDAVKLLENEILPNMTDEDVGIAEAMKEMKDELNNSDADYGFVPRGLQHLIGLMQLLLQHPDFVQRFRSSDDAGSDKFTWNTDAIASWLYSVQRFKELIFVLIHFTSGAPKRITELLLHKLYNTGSRIRNVYWMLKRFFFLGDYGKTTAISGADKRTLHCLALAIEPLFIRLCLVIVPLERYFLSELNVSIGLNGHCYLFSSYGARWTAGRAYGLFKKYTKRYLGQCFGAAAIRHIFPSIYEHYALAANIAVPASSIIADQQGHTQDVADRLYNVHKDKHGEISSAQVLQVVDFVGSLEKFWGLGSREGPTPVTDEMLLALVKDPIAAKIEAQTEELHIVKKQLGIIVEMLEGLGGVHSSAAAHAAGNNAMVQSLPSSKPNRRGSRSQSFTTSPTPQTNAAASPSTVIPTTTFSGRKRKNSDPDHGLRVSEFYLCVPEPSDSFCIIEYITGRGVQHATHIGSMGRK